MSFHHDLINNFKSAKNNRSKRSLLDHYTESKNDFKNTLPIEILEVILDKNSMTLLRKYIIYFDRKTSHETVLDYIIRYPNLSVNRLEKILEIMPDLDLRNRDHTLFINTITKFPRDKNDYKLLDYLCRLYSDTYFQYNIDGTCHYYIDGGEIPFLLLKEDFLDMYRKEYIDNDCMICQEFIGHSGILTCQSETCHGHYFCEPCLRKWLSLEHSTCPICRQDFIYEP